MRPSYTTTPSPARHSKTTALTVSTCAASSCCAVLRGLATGACVATLSPLEGLGTLPLATTVNGQMLTSVETIEAAVEAGLVTLLDTGAVLVGTISGK